MRSSFIAAARSRAVAPTRTTDRLQTLVLGAIDICKHDSLFEFDWPCRHIVIFLQRFSPKPSHVRTPLARSIKRGAKVDMHLSVLTSLARTAAIRQRMLPWPQSLI